MIQISKVSDSFFPEIDFKFKNSGKSAAVILEFTLRVLIATVDPTPVLKFRYEVNNREFVWRLGSPNGAWEGDGSLLLVTQNNGWGVGPRL